MTDLSLNDLNNERRAPIWIVLSEFYIDTELEEEDLERIFKVFRNSGFDLEEIKSIDRFEVFPLLQQNLLSPLPEWAGFNEAWLIEKCSRNYRKRNNFFHHCWCKIGDKWLYHMRKRYWDRIEELYKINGT